MKKAILPALLFFMCSLTSAFAASSEDDRWKQVDGYPLEIDSKTIQTKDSITSFWIRMYASDETRDKFHAQIKEKFPSQNPAEVKYLLVKSQYNAENASLFLVLDILLDNTGKELRRKKNDVVWEEILPGSAYEKIVDTVLKEAEHPNN